MMASIIPHSKPWITVSDREVVDEVLASGMIAKGEQVACFENMVRSYLGVKYSIAQSSGSAALTLGLKALRIAQNDEVILPTYVCRSVLESVLSVGATPVLCDVDDTGVVTQQTITPHITRKTKAIIAVHIFGHPVDMDKLSDFGVPIIEDACQAFGLSINGKMAGSIGDIGILSFHATKCLTTGEGGMLVTKSPSLAHEANLLAAGDSKFIPRHFSVLSDIQASLGIAQLTRYGDHLTRRERLRKLYSQEAENSGISIGAPSTTNALFRFTLRKSAPFESVQKNFMGEGVCVRRGVDELLHRQLGLSDDLFPVAVRNYSKTISIPFYPSLTDEESMKVCQTFKVLRDEF